MTSSPVADTAIELDAAVAEARRRFADRRPRSAEAHRAATSVMPGGNTRTVLYHAPFPVRAASAHGCRLVDVDGHEYLDLLGDYTAGLYGHDHPVITDAVRTALDDGLSFGAHNVHEAELARLVCQRFPGIDRVRFTNSGTEANLMAVATARYVTGRGGVLAFAGGYHGGLLSFGGSSPINAPYPFTVVDYNDAAAAGRVIDADRGELAAVLVEPMLGSGGCIPATAEFIETLRAATTDAGVLLVFDEVMTSRLAPGGAQERYGVVPDLSTLGKYVGGGLSFGAFGGRADIMDIYDPSRPGAIGHAGTFNNNVLSMAAGVAGLAQVLTPAALDELNDRGDRLRLRLNELFGARGVAVQATGTGSLLNIHPTAAPIARPADLATVDDRRRELLFLDLIEAGCYVARRGFIALSLAVTDADLDGFVDALAAVIDRRAALLR